MIRCVCVGIKPQFPPAEYRPPLLWEIKIITLYSDRISVITSFFWSQTISPPMTRKKEQFILSMIIKISFWPLHCELLQLPTPNSFTGQESCSVQQKSWFFDWQTPDGELSVLCELKEWCFFFQIFIGTVLKFHFHALYSDSQKFILQLVFLKLHLEMKTDHVFELFIMFRIESDVFKTNSLQCIR